MPMQQGPASHTAEGTTGRFRRWLGLAGHPHQKAVDSLYAQIVAAARQEVFFSQWQVPDTPLGRFEMLSLHMFLLQHKLRNSTGFERDIAQQLIDDFFTDIEHSLRELGIGDLGVPKRMKKLAKMFYGRTLSYASAIEQGDHAALADALARNIRPEVASWPESGKLAAYVMDADATLHSQPVAEILAGEVRFPAAVVA